jgi:RNA polymerase sigma-70 factor (ECF subfamily)
VDEEMESSTLRAARAAWPEIAIDPGGFAAHVEACRRAGGAAPEHLADLYLAWAAMEGDAVAVRSLDERVLAATEPAVRRVDGTAAFVDEVRQLLRVRLLVGAAGAPPRLAEYHGRGPLVGWARVAAVRIALNLKRDERPAAAIDDVLGELAAGDADPEVRYLGTLYRAEFGAALREALGALSDRDRALLRFHHVDGLKLAQIAALYRVHESTASRWISAAVEAIAEGARRRLMERLSLSSESLDSVARLVRSNLDLSLQRLLGAAP